MNKSELILLKMLLEKNEAIAIRSEAYQQTILIEIAKLRAKLEDKSIETIRDEQEFIYDRHCQTLLEAYTEGLPID